MAFMKFDVLNAIKGGRREIRRWMLIMSRFIGLEYVYVKGGRSCSVHVVCTYVQLV